MLWMAFTPFHHLPTFNQHHLGMPTTTFIGIHFLKWLLNIYKWPLHIRFIQVVNTICILLCSINFRTFAIITLFEQLLALNVYVARSHPSHQELHAASLQFHYALTILCICFKNGLSMSLPPCIEVMSLASHFQHTWPCLRQG